MRNGFDWKFEHLKPLNATTIINTQSNCERVHKKGKEKLPECGSYVSAIITRRSNDEELYIHVCSVYVEQH